MIAPPGTPLTPRELEVIEAYRRHGSYDATAIALGLSIFTVREHLANARSRRRVHRTWQLFGDNLAA
jgi:DNA-binding CsgD family transcriptional regulator